MSKIAFIGLGNVGGPIAANLVKAGHAVAGFDRVEAAKASAASAGVAIAPSAREAVKMNVMAPPHQASEEES